MKFSTPHSVRIAAVQQILPHLTSVDEAQTARPDVDQTVISTLPNLYCLRNPLDISLDTSNKSVLKVYIYIQNKRDTLAYTCIQTEISAWLMCLIVSRWSLWRNCFVSCPQTLLTSLWEDQLLNSCLWCCKVSYLQKINEMYFNQWLVTLSTAVFLVPQNTVFVFGAEIEQYNRR